MTAIVALRAERESRRICLKRAVRELHSLLNALEAGMISDSQTSVYTDSIHWKTEALIDYGRQLQAANEAIASAEHRQAS